VKPVLFVTGHAPAYRIGAFTRLHEREEIVVALFGGRAKHGGPVFEEVMPFPHLHVRPRALARLGSSGDYRAVVCPTGGRVAPLASWAGARAGRVPLLLWASLWAHPRTPAHALSYLPLRRLYRSADAVVTYGEHVSAYVRACGARNVHVAPQSVDNDFWRAAPSPADAAQTGAHAQSAGSRAQWRSGARPRFLFVGRDAPEKGLAGLLDAWRESGLAGDGAALALVGARSSGAPSPPAQIDGVRAVGAASPSELRELYRSADVVVVPSIRTRTFAEPWGLVVNEAMNCGAAVIASDAVGAAAGGLVRDGVTGAVFAAGDSAALAAAMRRMSADDALRERVARAGSDAVLAYSHDAWARGFSDALATVGRSLGRW
jgi:glycosyltransferase involved in cell wall biosynthesis